MHHAIAFICCVMIMSAGHAQERVPCDVGTAGLPALLDDVLPIMTPPVWKSGARKVTSIRHTPLDATSEPERRVSLTEMQDGRLVVEVWRLRGSLQSQVDRIVDKSDALTCDEIIKRIDVDRLVVPEQDLTKFRALLTQLLNTSIRADAQSAIYLDTAKYEYYVSGGMASLMLTIYPTTTQGKRPHPLLRRFDELLRLSDSAIARSPSKGPV